MDNFQKSYRLFVALRLPEEWSEPLLAERPKLNAGHWLPREHLHLTMRFLGEIPEKQAHQLAAAFSRALGGLPAIPMRPAGWGFFPNHHAPTSWHLNVGAVPELLRWKARVDEVILRVTGLAAETRGLLAHITLFRMRRRLPAAEETALAGWAQSRRLTETQAGALALFYSHQEAGRLLHTVLAEAPPGK